MSIYKALYDTTKDELEKIEIKLKGLKGKKETKKREYDAVKKRFEDQEELLDDLKRERDTMPQKHYFMLSVFAAIFSAISTFIVLAGGFNVIITKFIIGLNISVVQFALPITLGMMLVVCGGATVGAVITKIIQKKLEKFSSKRIINSLDYKKVLCRISELESVLVDLKEELKTKKEAFDVASREYDECVEERNSRKAFLSYVDSKINPKESTLHISKKLVPNNDDNNNI